MAEKRVRGFNKKGYYHLGWIKSKKDAEYEVKYQREHGNYATKTKGKADGWDIWYRPNRRR